ncbi:MAG: ABC transporter permease [Planctomycetota bacterium]
MRAGRAPKKIWRGELVEPRRLRARGLLLVGGGALWLLLLLVLPGLLLAAVAFTERDPYGRIEWTLSLSAWKRLAGFGTFGWSADYLRILARSVWVAGVTTALSLALAWPLAFQIARAGGRARWLWVALVTVPMATNLVVRTYAWELLLSAGLPPAALAASLGLIPPGTSLYPGTLATYLGMVSNALPFAVLPLYVNAERLDPGLSEAAQDLYASRWRALWQVVVPQMRPGLLAATVLTFVPAMGMFVITDRLGGAGSMILGNLIQQQFGPSRDYPLGSAVSLLLIVLTLAGLFLLRRRGDQRAFL